MSNLIAPSRALGYSNIFLDFLAQESSAMHFYPATGISEVAGRLDSVQYNRARMVQVLVSQNRVYGASEKTFGNIEKLNHPQSVCVFAGQQAGLFGGPLLVVYKALSLVKAASDYEAQLGRPVIPVFWIAGDDHDFEEVNHTWVINRASELTRIVYECPEPTGLSMAETRFTDANELRKAKEALKVALGITDFTGDLYELIESAYGPEDTFVTAFGKLMASLTADTGLVFFSPGDEAVKRLSVDLFKAVLEKEDELRERLEEANHEIIGRGYHLQVEKKPEASHLFYNLEGRKPIFRHDGGYIVGEKVFSREKLFLCIEEHPERFSPDVMTRPVLQSYLFPVVSQKGGAAELAYLAQIYKVFDLFGLVTPYYRARPSITIVERRFENLMNEHEIHFEELTGDIEQVVNRVLAKSFPDDIEDKFREFSKHLREHFQQFSGRSLDYDPNLKKVSEQTLGKIDFIIKGFEEKVFAAHKKKSHRTRERIYRLWQALYPNRSFQERVLNVTYFVSKYGRGFVNYVYDRMECEQKSHQLIGLSEYID